jgi:zinc transporter ZupT
MGIIDTPGWAFVLGFGSAVSLVIGAAIGLAARPRAVVTSALMAFGAGALLFALSIEIVAHSYHTAGFWPLALGCILGGVLFEILNQIINRRGGFLRKAAPLLRYVTQLKRHRATDVVEHLSHMAIFRALPPEAIAKLVPHVETADVPEGGEIFAEGEAGDALHLIKTGTVRVTRDNGATLVAMLGEGAAFGEMALLSGAPRNATVTAVRPTTLHRIARADFEELLKISPETRTIVLELARARAAEAPPPGSHDGLSREDWHAEAVRHLATRDLAPTAMEIQTAAAHAGGRKTAVLGIWLGILLDAIPESIVIGISIIGAAGAPWGLVAGVFLANLPEAMSSSVVMRAQNFSTRRILGLWSVIVLVTAAGAYFGNAGLRNLTPGAFAVIEGCAAGAMLTSIAETMLPEAYEQGGWIVGLSTLAGFLAALGVKALAAGH